MTTFPLVPAPLRASLAARRQERHERRRLAHDLAQYRTPQERLELSILLNRNAA